MSREYPDWISPERAAEGKRVFGGTVPFSRMRRLAPLLVTDAGEASFTASFAYDVDRRVMIDLLVEASLPLVCQASLEVYDESVKRRSELAVIAHDNEQARLPENYEAVKTDNGRLAIASLVEDELLLGVPDFPRKPGLQKIRYLSVSGVAENDNPQTGVEKNPFSALQNLLKRDEKL